MCLCEIWFVLFMSLALTHPSPLLLISVSAGVEAQHSVCLSSPYFPSYLFLAPALLCNLFHIFNQSLYFSISVQLCHSAHILFIIVCCLSPPRFLSLPISFLSPSPSPSKEYLLLSISSVYLLSYLVMKRKKSFKVYLYWDMLTACCDGKAQLICFI